MFSQANADGVVLILLFIGWPAAILALICFFEWIDKERPEDMEKGSTCFIFPERADRVWIFDGRELLMEKYDGSWVTVIRSANVPQLVRKAPRAVFDHLPREFREKIAAAERKNLHDRRT